jgi:hypothetical protein
MLHRSSLDANVLVQYFSTFAYLPHIVQYEEQSTRVIITIATKRNCLHCKDERFVSLNSDRHHTISNFK